MKISEIEGRLMIFCGLNDTAIWGRGRVGRPSFNPQSGSTTILYTTVSNYRSGTIIFLRKKFQVLQPYLMVVRWWMKVTYLVCSLILLNVIKVKQTLKSATSSLNIPGVYPTLIPLCFINFLSIWSWPTLWVPMTFNWGPAAFTSSSLILSWGKINKACFPRTPFNNSDLVKG